MSHDEDKIPTIRELAYEEFEKLGIQIVEDRQDKTTVFKFYNDFKRYYPHESHKEKGKVEVYTFRVDEVGGFNTHKDDKHCFMVQVDSNHKVLAKGEGIVSPTGVAKFT